jgi:AcrR family transcriptional regulator
MKHVSKAEWLQTALMMLEKEGIEAIRVERIARELGISKSGFYWHFKNRCDLQRQMMSYWAYEFSEIVMHHPDTQTGPPKKRLEKIMELLIIGNLTRYEGPFLAWAKTDPEIARQVRAVYKKRLNYLENIFQELGFEGQELEMRTNLFVCYHTWERSMFDKKSKKSLQSLIKCRVNLLTKK